MLDRATIERALAIAGAGPLVVGLSGGGDSVALTHQLVDRLGPERLKPIVVDHALREGSAADAARASEFVAPLGVKADVVTLDWGVAPQRAQQAARTARLKALCEAARRLGARAVVLGHTADDQAETVLMRAAAGSGWRGLAGIAPIAPAPVWPEGRGIALARPLIGVRREALRAYLRARAAPWLEDPANTNPVFERVRVRERLEALEATGFDPLRLSRLTMQLRARASQLDQAAAELIERAARFDCGRVVIDGREWTGDVESRQRALAVVLTAVGGAERAPESAALARLDARMAVAGFSGGALAGVRVAPAKGGFRMERDVGALLGRAGGPSRLAAAPLPVGEEKVWDGRVSLRATEPGWSVEPSPDAMPILVRGDEQIQLSAAVEGAVVTAEWLVEAHAKHLLAFL